MADFLNGSAAHAAQILDHNGNPFVRELRDPNSPAYAGGRVARDQGVFAAPHVLTFSSIWSSAYRTYGHRWDEAMRSSREDTLAMRRDAFLSGIVQERKLASSQLNWHLEPENAKDPRQKATAAFLEKIIRRMRGLPKMFFNLSDAIWYGRSGAHLALAWKQMERPKEIPGPSGESRVLVPCRYYPINGDKIQYRYRMAEDEAEIEDGTPVVLGHSAYLANLPKGETVITDRGRGLLLRNSYWRERYIIHQHEPDDADFFEAEMAGGVHGVGVRSRIYWAWWLRSEWLSNVSDFIQKIGQGVLIVYFEAGNPESEAKAIQIANNISNNTVIVWPRPIGGEKQGAGVEKMDMPMAGSEVLLKLQLYMDGVIERYIIGQSASSKSETSGMGTHDTGAQEDTKFRIIRFDANNLGDTLTHDLVAPLQRWNCPQEDYLISLVLDVDKPNAKDMLSAAKSCFDMGASIKEEEVLATAGLSVPQPDDKVLKNPQFNQPSGGAPGAPGAGGPPGMAAPMPGPGAGGPPAAPAAPAMAEHPMPPPMAPPMEPGAEMAQQPMQPEANDLESLMASLLGEGEQFGKRDQAEVMDGLHALAEQFAKKRAPEGVTLHDGEKGGKYYVTKGGHRVYVEGGSVGKKSRAEVVASVAKKASAKEVMRRMVEHGQSAMDDDAPPDDMAAEVRRFKDAVNDGRARYLDVVDFMARIEDAGKGQAEMVARQLGLEPSSKQDALKKLHGFMMGEHLQPRKGVPKPAANFGPKIPVNLPPKNAAVADKPKGVNWEKPWEHTLDEFLGLGAKDEADILKEHRRMVERALDGGHDVPESVLNDYPDLAARRKKPSGDPGKSFTHNGKTYTFESHLTDEEGGGEVALTIRDAAGEIVHEAVEPASAKTQIEWWKRDNAAPAPVGAHDFTPAEQEMAAAKERKRKAAALINLVKYRSSSAGPSAADFKDIVEHLSTLTPSEIREVAEKTGMPTTGGSGAERIVEAIKAKRDQMGMHGGVRKFSAEDSDSIALVNAIMPIISRLFGSAA